MCACHYPLMVNMHRVMELTARKSMQYMEKEEWPE